MQVYHQINSITCNTYLISINEIQQDYWYEERNMPYAILYIWTF